MCETCGCGVGGPVTEHRHRADRRGEHPPAGDGEVFDGHGVLHGARGVEPLEVDGLGSGVGVAGEKGRWVEVRRSLLEHNDRFAERNRGLFRARRLLVLNVLGSPGAGKTALIEKTGQWLRPALRTGAIVGDLATDNDARRIRAAGIPVVQVSTGTLCHLEADMVARAMEQLDLDALDVLIIENVGNLVCPAGYDLGEQIRVVLLSVAEGEDKPLKYPPMFHSADVALLTKVDLAEVLGFDRDQALANLERVSHHARVLEVSARTGQGMDAWVRLLLEQYAALRA